MSEHVPQISKEDGYRFETYGGVSRFASYAYQLREILRLHPTSILEIGAGDAVVGNYIKRQTAIAYTSVDFATDLVPDIVADVRSLPCTYASYDIVCAFEVLEHLPFEDFSVALSELFRVARTHVLISLPHFGPPVQIYIKIPFLSALKFAFKIPFPRKHTFNGQHYWEIGKQGYRLQTTRAILSTYGTIINEFVPFENQYHHFFVVKKK
jgi:ubiquinone/menaquinone biosynthesis C-methylase UbiE